MKLCSSKIITALIAAASLCLPSSAEQAEQADKVRTKPAKGSPEYYEYRMERYNQFWRSLIPNQARVQYAGSVGAANIGLGWHYGGRDKRLWETDFMFGFVPKSSAPEAHLTFTIRQSYIPFRLRMTDWLAYEPLSTGLIFNTIFGEQFWVNEPSRYPNKYYGFSSAVRFHAFLGQRLRYEIPQRKRKFVKAISFCYELSASDLYLVSYVPNKNISLRDILSLSVGVKVDAF
ncbi:MAG: hypothetical protein IKN22_00125 [Bacteroidaceae bacterium]|nr:hypothetical protein [Bacteroidaceae bacterium]